MEAWLLSGYGLITVVCEHMTLNIGQTSNIGIVFLDSFWNYETKETEKKLQFLPQSLGAMLEY